MKKLWLLLFLILLQNCSKTKTVNICGDHVCVNKEEAKQYFEENLTLEVKVLNKKNNQLIDLVELNLSGNENLNKKIAILKKEKTKNKIKVLSSNEKKIIKSQVIKKARDNKKIKKNILIKSDDTKELNHQASEKSYIRKKDNDNRYNELKDVCSIIEKCNIEEISKYLLEQAKKNGYPDISLR